MDCRQQKNELRKKMLSKRNALPLDWKISYDNKICSQLSAFIQQNHFQVIHSFIPMGSEVNLLPLLDEFIQSGKTVVSPKTLPNGRLEHRLLFSTDDLESGVFTTRHPRKKKLYAGRYDCILVPGLAFNQTCQRLGYGGGYYDRFLQRHQQAFTIAPIYPFQLVKNLPVEQHDQAVDKLIMLTE